MPTTESDIRAIIEGGKKADCDWFKEETPTEKIALVLGAMANSLGGTLLLGIGPTGMIEGVQAVEPTIDRVLEAALTLSPVLIIPMPRTLDIEGKSVVVVTVPPGMPNVYALEGRYLRRDGTANVGLAPGELRRLIIERGVTSYEAEVAPNTSINDIDWEKARAYARSLSSVGEQESMKILERRGCLVQFNGEMRPTNAGILLFGKDPQRHIRGSEITAARFAGNTMGDVFNREDIMGTLPDQIRRAETFLADHLRKGIQLGSTMERHEELEYPMEAARELVVNAVAHRDYSITGDGIRLFLFRDHMEVSSPGGLAGPVTVDNIKEERFSRNPVIVQVLADMGFIERLGYGVDRVFDLMQAQNLPEPEFKEMAGGFRVVLYRAPEREDPAPRIEATVKKLIQSLDVPLNPRQETAIHFLQKDGNSRITNSDLQDLCPGVHAETLRRDLADLVDKKILIKMGQKRGSYYVLRKHRDSNGDKPA